MIKQKRHVRRGQLWREFQGTAQVVVSSVWEDNVGYLNVEFTDENDVRHTMKQYKFIVAYEPENGDEW